MTDKNLMWDSRRSFAPLEQYVNTLIYSLNRKHAQ